MWLGPCFLLFACLLSEIGSTFCFNMAGGSLPVFELGTSSLCVSLLCLDMCPGGKELESGESEFWYLENSAEVT